MKFTDLTLSKVSAWLVPLSIMLLMAGLAHSPFFARQPERLSLGITVDLVLTAPLLYWLLIRQRSIPNVTVFPLFVVGAIIAGIILPEAYQAPLIFVKTWFLPLVELSVLTVVVTRVRRISIDYRRVRKAFTAVIFHVDNPESFKRRIDSALPSLNNANQKRSDLQ